MKPTEGTPHTLGECAINILCFRPPVGVKPDIWVKEILQDYLSQKFSVALLKAQTENEKKLIRDLWNKTIGET